MKIKKNINPRLMFESYFSLSDSKFYNRYFWKMHFWKFTGLWILSTDRGFGSTFNLQEARDGYILDVRNLFQQICQDALAELS